MMTSAAIRTPLLEVESRMVWGRTQSDMIQSNQNIEAKRGFLLSGDNNENAVNCSILIPVTGVRRNIMRYF